MVYYKKKNDLADYGLIKILIIIRLFWKTIGCLYSYLVNMRVLINNNISYMRYIKHQYFTSMIL